MKKAPIDEPIKVPFSEEEEEKLVETGIQRGFSRKYLETVRLWLLQGKLVLRPKLGEWEVGGGSEVVHDSSPEKSKPDSPKPEPRP